jgi:hypothetical protein
LSCATQRRGVRMNPLPPASTAARASSMSCDGSGVPHRMHMLLANPQNSCDKRQQHQTGDHAGGGHNPTPLLPRIQRATHR